VAGHAQHGNVRPRGTNGRDHFRSARSRHRQIGNQQIDLVLERGCADRFLAIRGADNGVAGVGQDAGKIAAHGRFILDEQNGLGPPRRILKAPGERDTRLFSRGEKDPNHRSDAGRSMFGDRTAAPRRHGPCGFQISADTGSRLPRIRDGKYDIISHRNRQT
jgi:hypothetical protein